MTDSIFRQFIVILPEIMLTLLALMSQLSVLLFNSKIKIITNITILLSIILICVILYSPSAEIIAFNNSFFSNNLIKSYKCLILFFSIITIIIYDSYCKINGELFKTEFITLILLSVVGIFVAISARNFLLLFCSMELQALIAYVLAGFSLNNIKSSEGALKYFILGALISCLTLFGLSFIYGFGGSLNYSDIFQNLNQPTQPNIGLVIGVVLFLSGILFKLSAVPLHMWTPDVYQGSPIPSVTYFAAATKIGNVIILLNIVTMVVGEYKQISVDLIQITAILSMIVGATGAIRQNSLKRLMGYSTILNIGYVLMAISLHSILGNQVAILYMVIYGLSVIGFFACLISLTGKQADLASFDDIKGLASSRKALSAGITVIIFSMIGIPPLAGFFGKYYLFYQAIIQGQFTLAIIAIATSVVAAYYYLKIIKSIYFLTADSNFVLQPIATHNGLKFVSCLVITILLLFSLIVIF